MIPDKIEFSIEELILRYEYNNSKDSNWLIMQDGNSEIWYDADKIKELIEKLTYIDRMLKEELINIGKG